MEKTFTMDAREFGIFEAEQGDLVLVTINFEEKRADYVWYNPNNPTPMNNPANHLSETMPYDEAIQLMLQYDTPIIGRWCGDKTIEVGYADDGHLYALHGWNGEEYVKCFRLSDDGYDVLEEEEITIQPLYEEDEDGFFVVKRLVVK